MGQSSESRTSSTLIRLVFPFSIADKRPFGYQIFLLQDKPYKLQQRR